MRSRITSYFTRLIFTCAILVLGAGIVPAQQLLQNGTFDATTADWITACTSVEATYDETTYGGTDPSNHVAEVDDESCFYQDVCVLPGASYVYTMDASRRTTGAGDTITTHLKITGLDPGGALLATYVDMDFVRYNTVFGFTAVSGIPVITVPPSSGVVRLRVALSDNTPGYSTYGMIVDNLSLTFLTPPVVAAADSVCQNVTATFAIINVSSPALTYLWNFSAGSTPATSAVATPTVSWSVSGPASGTVDLGNGTCPVDTVGFSIYIGGRVANVLNDTTCSNVPYIFRGVSLSRSGTYIDTISSPSGCDTILTLNLFVRRILTGTINSTICNGSVYTYGTRSYGISGVYSVDTVTNPAGCDSIVLLNLTVNPVPPPPAISAMPNTYCFGQAFVPFTVVSGTGVQWYNSAAGGAGFTTPPFVNTAVAGYDTFWATQTILGCESDRLPIYITVQNRLTANFTPVIKNGCTADTVVFTNASVGATAYTWDLGDSSVGYRTMDITHVYHAQGLYTVTLWAINGICIDSARQTIDLQHPLKAAFLTDSALICQGGQITFTDESIGTGITHLWSFGDGVVSNTINPVHPYPNTGVYKVFEVVTDVIPCRDTAFTTISVDSNSQIKMLISDTVLCVGTYATFTGIYSLIGNTGIIWDFGNGTTTDGINPIPYGYLAAGTYTVTATPLYRICPEPSVSRKMTIIAQPLIFLGNDTSICKGGVPMQLTDRINETNTKARWAWNTGATTPGITIVQPGTYSASVTIDGCTATSAISIKNDCFLDIPNVFSPNGDGLNDYFIPLNYLSSGLSSFKMEIFNRWGQQIFEANTIDGRGWDGKFNNTNQPEGVYIYQISATFRDGQKENRTGNITLVR